MSIGAIVKIRYNEKECKSVLNKSGIADYAVNCYTGCAHACVYCYARFASRFTHPGEPWGSYVDVKINAPEVLAKEIKRKKPGRVMLSSVCDAWQPAEARYGLTRQCLEILTQYKFEISTLTKNELASRDLDILSTVEKVDFGVTITSLDKPLCRAIEPLASAPEKRLELLEKAKSKGLTTYAFVGPLLPYLSDTAENIESVLKAVKETGIDYFYLDKTNLRYGVWPALLKMLRERYPHLEQKYREIFFQPAANARYIGEIYKNARESAAKLGIADKMTIC